MAGAEAAGGDAAAWRDGLSEARVEAILRDAETLAKADGIEVETHRRKGDAADAILAVAKDTWSPAKCSVR
jgi:nucleotide-binding universal stress UspA family protein